MLQLGFKRRLVCALLIGSAIAALPYLTRNLAESGTLGGLKVGIAFLGMPGVALN